MRVPDYPVLQRPEEATEDDLGTWTDRIIEASTLGQVSIAINRRQRSPIPSHVGRTLRAIKALSNVSEVLRESLRMIKQRDVGKLSNFMP